MSTRDSSIDVVRAVAIAGVVTGHWAVTGLVVGPDGVLLPASPLTAMPALAPVTWVLQTLGLFFFAGGFAAARAGGARASAGGLRRRPGAPLPPAAAGSPAGRPVAIGRLARRLAGLVPSRLLGPLAVLASLWAVALGVAALAGVPRATLVTVGLLVVSPLWFLLPYLALRAATGPLVRVVERVGPAVPAAVGVVVVAASDLRLVPGWLAVAAAWSVPWVLGVALARDRLGVAVTPGRPGGQEPGPLARGRLSGPWVGALLLVGGVLGGAVLTLVAGYPASAVGVPGATRSNLNPPSLFAVALAIAQIGVFLLVRSPLTRRRPGRLVATMNRAALPIYLGHQSVLIAVTVAVALVAPGAPGLLTAPDGPGWVWWRIVWLPVLAVVLGVTVVRSTTSRSGGRRRGVPVQDP